MQNSTRSHNLIGGIYQATPDTISENKAVPIRLSNKGAVHK